MGKKGDTEKVPYKIKKPANEGWFFKREESMKKIYQKSVVVVFDGFMISEICEHSVRKE